MLKSFFFTRVAQRTRYVENTRIGIWFLREVRPSAFSFRALRWHLLMVAVGSGSAVNTPNRLPHFFGCHAGEMIETTCRRKDHHGLLRNSSAQRRAIQSLASSDERSHYCCGASHCPSAVAGIMWSPTTHVRATRFRQTSACTKFNTNHHTLKYPVQPVDFLSA